MVRREIEQELNQRKIAMTSALWANSAWDESEKADRSQALKNIEDSFDRAILMVYGEIDEEQEEIDFENDPFFSPAKKMMDRMDVPEGSGQDTTVREMIELDEDVDQT